MKYNHKIKYIFQSIVKQPLDIFYYNVSTIKILLLDHGIVKIRICCCSMSLTNVMNHV